MDWMTKTEKENPSLFGPIGKSKDARNDLKPIYTGMTSSMRGTKGRLQNNRDEESDDYDDRSSQRYEDDNEPVGPRRKRSVRRAVNRTMRFFKGLNDDEKLVFGVVSAAVVIGVVLFILRVRASRSKQAMSKELEQKQQSLAGAGEASSSTVASASLASGAAVAEDADVVRSIKLATSDCRFLHEKFALVRAGMFTDGMTTDDANTDILTEGEHTRMTSHSTALRSIASQHSSEAIFAATGVNIGDLIKTVDALVAMPVAQSSSADGSWKSVGASHLKPTSVTGSIADARRIPRRNPFARPLND